MKQETIKLEVNCSYKNLYLSRFCNLDARKHFTESPFNVDNCWIAVAVHEILPKAGVDGSLICNGYDESSYMIKLPEIAKDKISEFDSCRTIEERLKLKPFKFTVEIDEETLDKILKENNFSSNQWMNIVNNSEHLNLV